MVLCQLKKKSPTFRQKILENLSTAKGLIPDELKTNKKFAYSKLLHPRQLRNGWKKVQSETIQFSLCHFAHRFFQFLQSVRFPNCVG